jgi:hypothetical protein
MDWNEAFTTLTNYDVPVNEARKVLRRAKVLNEAAYGNITVIRTNPCEFSVYVA